MRRWGEVLRKLRRLIEKLIEAYNKLHLRFIKGCFTIRQETQSRAIVLGQSDRAPLQRKE